MSSDRWLVTKTSGMIRWPGKFRWPGTNGAATGQEDGWAKSRVGPFPWFFRKCGFYKT